jgi:hypothetical protein
MPNLQNARCRNPICHTPLAATVITFYRMIMTPTMLDRVRERFEGHGVVGIVILASGNGIRDYELGRKCWGRNEWLGSQACHDMCAALFDSDSNSRRSNKIGRCVIELAHVNGGQSSRTGHGCFDRSMPLMHQGGVL